MAEQWLSIVEYARTFAVSDMTVRRRIKTGKLRAVLREGKYYIPLSEGDHFIEEEPLNELQPRQAPRQISRPLLGSEVTAAGPASVGEEKPLSDLGQSRYGASTKTLPSQITQHLQRSDSTLVDSQALLHFCEQSMTRISSIERHIQDSFQQRLQNLETQLKLKDGVIVQLKQQVEDLQMLVKLMEQR